MKTVSHTLCTVQTLYLPLKSDKYTFDRKDHFPWVFFFRCKEDGAFIFQNWQRSSVFQWQTLEENSHSSIYLLLETAYHDMPFVKAVIYSPFNHFIPSLQFFASIPLYSWWRSTVVRTSVYDRRTFPGLRHDVRLTGDLLGLNHPLYMSANMANSAIHPHGVKKWVVSWTQTFAMCLCVVAPPWECLRVKADMVLLADNIVWSMFERVR